MSPRALALQRRLEAPLLLAALLTIPALVIEESGAGATLDTVAVVLNWVVWLAFVAEAVLMLRVVDSKGAWLRSHPLEVVIVLMTPPLLPAGPQAARVFRLLRVLRLLRGALLVRRLLSTEGVRDAAVFALLTVLAGGVGYAAIENSRQTGHGALSAWDGIWWAITTVTTVGYGDQYPVTAGGRLIAIVVMLVGIGFVAILTAAAAQRFMRAEREETTELVTG